MPTLDDLEQEHLQLKIRLDALLTASEGEVTDEIEALMDERLESEYALSQKFDGYGYAMAQLQAEEELLQARIDALQQRLQTKRNTRERMKERLQAFMERNGAQKVEGDYFVFRVQKNGGRRPVEYAEGLRPEDVPEAYRRVRVELDGAAIYEALTSGTELAFARLGERGTHLRVL